MQLEVTDKRMSDGVGFSWETTFRLPSVSTVVDELVHHLPSTVESTLASLPYDSLYFPSCIDADYTQLSPPTIVT